MIEVENLVKKFNGLVAVDDISFSVQKGEILGFLGSNGAGKTTTIMMLLGVIKPTQGTIKILGLDFSSNREKILNRVNFASAYTRFPSRLSVFENLRVFSYFYGIPRSTPKIKKLLKKFGLADLENRITGNLSSGESTRLNLCKALINDPQFLFLDEPTASLDPDIAHKVREILFEIRQKRNVSMLYTSHNMEEVTQMCDRVIFLDKGKIVASDTPLNLAKMIKGCLLILTFEAPLIKVKNFCLNKKLNFQIPRPNILEITIQEKAIGQVLIQLTKENINITDIAIQKPSLEDVFFKIAHQEYEFIKN